MSGSRRRRTRNTDRGRGAGIATNGMGHVGRKRLPRAKRMALKGRR